MGVPPPRPAPAPKGAREDADLWKSYSNALKTKFFANLDPKHEAFYAAPIGAVVVPVGTNIHQEITNKAIADIGDTLMDLKNPVYGTNSQSYIQRVSRLLGAVKLRNNTDMGAQKRLNDAKAKAAKLEQWFNEAQGKAQEAYFADEDKGNATFRQWVPQNYPSVWSLEQERQAAMNTEASLRAQLEGPGAAELNRYKNKNFQAAHVWTEYPGLNMYTAVVPGDIPKEMRELPDNIHRVLRPKYNLASSLKDSVDNWNSAAEAGRSSVSFGIADSRSADWQSLGLSELNASSQFNSCDLFRVQYNVGGQLKEERLTAQEAGSDLKMTITAADFGTFSISPGDWDVPNLTEMYPRFESNVDMTLPAASRPDQILVGYKVGIEISLPVKLVERIKELASKAASTGGYVNFFGYNIDFRNDSALWESILKGITSTSISIPPRNLGYPILLGVKSKKVPSVKITRG